MPDPGRVLAGRYLLERLIAEGGMGEVWAARHRALDVPVAIKLMSQAALANPTLRTRFEREAKVGARLRTPHAVQVFDYGLAEDEAPFLVMELLEGEDFAEVGAKKERFSLAETVDLLSQVAKGLAAAHQEGVIHRDVKPSNLFLARVSAGQQIVKVLDFGIAKLAEEQKLTKTSVILGSPSYMSPEQVLGNPVGPRTDVWGLGVVAFWMLSGELPFKGPTAADVGERIVSGDRPNLTEIARGLPDEVDDVFERALAVEAIDRYASPLEMMEALSKIDRAHPDTDVARPMPQLATERHPRGRKLLSGDATSISTQTTVLQTLKRTPSRTVPMPPGRVAGLRLPLQATEETEQPRTDPMVALGAPVEREVTAPHRDSLPSFGSEPGERRTTKRNQRPKSSAAWWILPVVALIVVLAGLGFMLNAR